MKYTLHIDIDEEKILFAEEFFKSITFIKNVKIVNDNEITNEKVLKRIHDFENGISHPTPLNLEELKKIQSREARLAMLRRLAQARRDQIAFLKEIKPQLSDYSQEVIDKMIQKQAETLESHLEKLEMAEQENLDFMKEHPGTKQISGD